MSAQTQYLHSRYDEKEARARAALAGDLAHLPYVEITGGGRIYLGGEPHQVLAECKANRKILELHESWPVLVEGSPVLADDLQSSLASITQQIVWMTEREYRDRFGDDPPTSPIIRAMLQPYADRDDFEPTWKDS